MYNFFLKYLIALCIIFKSFLINFHTFNHFTLFVGWSIIWKENVNWLYQTQDQLNRSRSKNLKTIFPRNAEARRQGTSRAVNPVPYRADYIGIKLHMNQNEKLERYSITHLAAIDGHSRMIVSWTTMPVKNNLIIYPDVYGYEDPHVVFLLFSVQEKLTMEQPIEYLEGYIHDFFL